jgi:hypothetical protein
MSQVWSILARLSRDPGEALDETADLAEAARLVVRTSGLTSEHRSIAVVRGGDPLAVRGAAGTEFPGTALLEPSSRGSAVAVMASLLHVLDRDLEATLLLLPLGQSVEREERLIASLATLLDCARRWDGSMVVMATVPSSLDCGGGWLVPVHSGSRERTAPVAVIARDPDPTSAYRFVRRGALISTDVMAVSGRTLLGMFALALPRQLGEAISWRERAGGGTRDLRQLYARLAPRDLYEDVLERCADMVRVLPAAGRSCCTLHARGEDWETWRDAPSA